MNATERKREQRKKEKENGDVTISIRVTKQHAERLDFICEIREYDRAELVALLIHRDWQKVKKKVKGLGECEFCQEQLPKGCEGKFKGRGMCFKTIKQRELLSL